MMVAMPNARQALFALALVAVALAALASSPCGNYFGFDAFGLGPAPTAVTCSTPVNGLFWLELAAIALAFSIALVSIGWSLGGLLGSPKYNEFLKARLWDILETAVIMGVLIAFLLPLQEYGNGNIDTARAYTKIIRNTAVEDFQKSIAGTAVFSFVANSNPKIHLFKGNFGSYIDFQLSPMFKPIFDMLGIIIQLQTTVVLQWFAHDYMLCFVKNYLFTLLLPAGLFLRAFGIKAAGNALIGIALALYFVYPFMIVQIGSMVTRHYEDELAALTLQEGYIHASICGGHKPICCFLNGALSSNQGAPDQNETLVIKNGNENISVNKILTNPVLGCSYATTNMRVWNSASSVITNTAVYTVMISLLRSGVTGDRLNTATGFLNILTIAAFIPAMTMLVLGFIYGLAYFFFIVSMVLPIFTIFITLTLAKEITKALGTEIDLSALEKLI